MGYQSVLLNTNTIFKVALNVTKIYSKMVWKDTDIDPCWSLAKWQTCISFSGSCITAHSVHLMIFSILLLQVISIAILQVFLVEYAGEDNLCYHSHSWVLQQLKFSAQHLAEHISRMLSSKMLSGIALSTWRAFLQRNAIEEFISIAW